MAQPSTCVTTAAPTTRRSPVPCFATAAPTCCTCGGAKGLLVAPGNPHDATTPADLVGLRVAQREVGAGTRVLLDQLLTAHGIAVHQVEGLELHSHLEIALAVASGIADVGLGLRSVANDLDLDFIPLTWEPYDIALGGDALGAAKPLITALRASEVQASISNLGGYDLEPAGTVEPLGD